jgi:hypothetical protein
MTILIGMIIIFVLIFLLGHYLGKHHGEKLAIKFTAGVFVLSFILALLPLLSLYKSIDDDMNLNASWEKVKGLEETVSELQYRSDEGLYAITDNNEIKIASEIPLCSADRQSIINPSNIEITSSPRVNLPALDSSVKQQISFDFIQPTGEESYGSSSFAIYNNGEVWCIEKFMGGGMAYGMALGWMVAVYMVISSFVFVSSFIILSILIIIFLNVIRVKNTNLYQKISN